MTHINSKSVTNKLPITRAERRASLTTHFLTLTEIHGNYTLSAGATNWLLIVRIKGKRDIVIGYINTDVL